jgi:mxaJ protein
MKLTLLLAVMLLSQLPRAAQALTVCADPNNLPFSNRQEQGFENKLMAILAKDLGTPTQYVWWAQRRGFARNTLTQSKCDVWPGVVSGLKTMATSQPYYRSTYVFVTRADRPLAGLSLDDPRLKGLLIGVQMIGDDGVNTPPAQALAQRGLTDNVRGYMLYGDYRQANPPAAIIDGVARGKIDVALVWGPLAGFFAKRSAIALRLEPIAQTDEVWKMSYNIAIGVRRNDSELLERINSALAANHSAIDELLRKYGVPRLPVGE